VSHLLANLVLLVWIKPIGRFVKDQKLRVVQDRQPATRARTRGKHSDD
jgi:hypothetical protein